MPGYLFGADFGTSGVKAILLDPITGKQWSSDLFCYEMKHKHPLWAEQTPEDWIAMLSEAVKQVLARAEARPEDISAISFSTFGCTTVCVDDHNEAIGDAITWMDGRTGEEVDWLNQNMACEISKVNGNVISTLPTTANFLWLRNKDPERYVLTKKFGGVLSYLNLRMTGNFTVPPSEATFIHVFDLKTLKYSEKLCNQLIIPLEKLAPIVSSTTQIGTITAEASQAVGFAEGTPVIAGMQDNAAASLGMGVYEPGQLFFSMGTAGNMGLIIDEPRQDHTLITQVFLFPKTWIMLATMGNNGACIKWFDNNIVSHIIGSNIGYESLDMLAKKSRPGNTGVIFLPYLSGELSPIWDERARSCFIGMTLRTNACDLIRSILEGVCFAIKHNLLMYQRAGCHIGDSIKIAGGPTNSPLWMQILADITGKEIVIPVVADAGPLGDAMLAGIANGMFSSPKEAVEQCVRIKQSYEPNISTGPIYKELFDIYLDISEKFMPEFHRLEKF